VKIIKALITINNLLNKKTKKTSDVKKLKISTGLDLNKVIVSYQ